MVSTYNRKVDIKNEIIDIMEYRGLSTDLKPLLNENVGNGSMFIEIDTGDIYLFSQEDDTWYKIGGSGGGADLTKYFNNSFTSSGLDIGWASLIKKIPEPISITVSNGSMRFAFENCYYIPQFTITNENTITDWSSCFVRCKDTRKLDLSNIQFNELVYDLSYMFEESYFDEIDISSLGIVGTPSVSHMFYGAKAKKIDLSNFYMQDNNYYADYMFKDCTNLEELDMSSFDFSKLNQYSDMFTNVPNNCLIYVKDQNQVDWFNTKFPSLINVQIKGE